MYQCYICLENQPEYVTCDTCSLSSCTKCTKLNNDKCCHCLRIFDECEREVARQIMLLDSTRKELIVTSSNTNSPYKQCPVCTVYIEKAQTGCSQIYCTVCKSVWLWDTLDIVNNPAEIHNPIYYEKNIEYKAPSYLHPVVQRVICKCMKSLYQEEAKYASDTFLNRIMCITDIISFNQFKERAKERYNIYTKHARLRKVLESPIINQTSVSSIDASYSIIFDALKLPYV